MHCEDLRPLIEKLSDDECSPSEKARAKAHLLECETCREHYRFLRALPEAARRLPLPEPPAAYWDVLPRKIMARIEEEETSKASKGWLSRWFTPAGLRWAGAMAAGAVALVTGLEVIDRWQSNAPPTEISTETKLVKQQEVAPPLLAETGDTPEQARPEEPDPQKKSGPADEPPSKPTSPPEPVIEKVAPARPQEAPASSSPPPALRARRRVAEGDAERPGGSASLDAISRVPSRVGRDEEEVNTMEARETDELRSPQVASLQAAAVPEETGTEAEDEASAAFSSLEGRSLRRGKPSLGTTSTGTGGSPDSELVAHCRSWRDYLEKYPDSAEALDARYRLARCSIDLYHQDPSEERRLQAIEDAEVCLKMSPEGERAEEIERLLSGLREPKND